MILYIPIVVLTIIYMIQSACMDIKEKKIYSNLCLMLAFDWALYLMYAFGWNKLILLAYWAVHIVLYFIFNKFHVWGAGDSDMWMLLMNVHLAVFGPRSVCEMVIGECMCLVATLGIAIVISFIESKVKKEKFNKHYKAAVAPGFAVVISILMAAGLVWRIIP